MTCEERLSHAIHVDKIKIYPNSTVIVEKTKKRQIQENYNERVDSKFVNNAYSKEEDLPAGDFFGVHPVVAERSKKHSEMLARKDQTWYFVLADCKGT